MSEPETQPALHVGDALLIPLADGLMIETPAGEDSATVRGADLLLLARAAFQHAAPNGGPLFTWEDVDMLRSIAERLNLKRFGGYESADYLSLLADCLESLLPPRTEPEPKEEG